ncbi:MAG: hypothetical protein B7X51_01305 [Pseudomonas sp. 34-62-33]|nr:MAG: hypothetical protein B7X51_01305 [Pseudomonas sp. 34-62-33]
MFFNSISQLFNSGQAIAAIWINPIFDGVKPYLVTGSIEVIIVNNSSVCAKPTANSSHRAFIAEA